MTKGNRHVAHDFVIIVQLKRLLGILSHVKHKLATDKQ